MNQIILEYLGILDTLFTGKVVKRFTETTSTNEMAADALKNGKVIEGSVFRADNQTAGKGQRGRVWESSHGQNILASYVFYPHFLGTDEQFNLIKAISLAVKDLLDKYLIDKATIKWPNDIYINDSKITGILVESAMKGNFMSSSIIGIGLNVNQRKFGDLVNATSVVLETGKGCDVDMFFNELSYHLEKRYLQLKRDKNAADKEYAKALYRLNQKSLYWINNKKVELALVGVDELGQLLLEDKHGNQNAFAMHEVKMIV